MPGSYLSNAQKGHRDLASAQCLQQNSLYMTDRDAALTFILFTFIVFGSASGGGGVTKPPDEPFLSLSFWSCYRCCEWS